jgi:hypothetical protein
MTAECQIAGADLAQRFNMASMTCGCTLVLVPVDYCGCQKEATPNRNTAERGADKSEAEQ